ncbi:MAG: YeeE/YedE family protein [Magnetospirillum gryphiswaldense]|nr:YeeE/YedE family protein [Magnetospirillum gryphiswaldense]
MRRQFSAFASGVLFGCGLLLSGMAEPARVLGFLDVLGIWDPSLAFVMGGGLTVTALGYQWCLRRSGPLCAVAYQIPQRRDLDARLFLGSALFGLGWGLVGYCPGPALLAGAAGLGTALWFCGAMLAGMLCWRLMESSDWLPAKAAKG